MDIVENSVYYFRKCSFNINNESFKMWKKQKNLHYQMRTEFQ